MPTFVAHLCEPDLAHDSGRTGKQCASLSPTCRHEGFGVHSYEATIERFAIWEDTMRKAVFAFFCFALLQVAGIPATAQQSVKVGLVMSYTGQFTDAAAQMDRGITLYMKQNGDTVAGKKIELIRKDTAAQPDVARR